VFSPEELSRLAVQIQKQLSQGEGDSYSATSGDCDPCVKKDCLLAPLTPQNALVIFGLLTGVLEVDSVLLDRDRTIQIILEGSFNTLKIKKKTNMDKKLDKLGSMPFDQVVKTLLERL